MRWANRTHSSLAVLPLLLARLCHLSVPIVLFAVLHRISSYIPSVVYFPVSSSSRTLHVTKAVWLMGMMLLLLSSSGFISPIGDPFILAQQEASCPRRLDDPNYFRCPLRECKKSLDCWIPHGSPEACICDPHLCGRVCVMEEKRCPFLRNPDHGSVSYSGRIVSSVAKYSCEEGYVVKGVSKRFCLATFDWSNDEPECSNRTDLCSPPPTLLNTEIENIGEPPATPLDYKKGDSIKIRCQKGFRDPGKDFVVAHCGANQKWAFESIYCDAVKCGQLPNLRNGRTVYPNTEMYSYKSKAVQFCNDGFTIQCSKPVENYCERYCLENGKWSGDTPTCKEVLCPKLTIPKNGSVQSYWQKVNSLVTFSCDPGFQLVGSKFLKCQRNGLWDGDKPVCIPRKCENPPYVANAKANFSSTEFNSIVVYTCLPLSTLSGESRRLRCGELNDKSLWLPQPPPQCLRHCHPLSVEYGEVFIVTSSNTSVLMTRQKGVQHAVTARIDCAAGHSVDRPQRPMCNNGSWTYIPKCLPSPCSRRPMPITNGLARFYSQEHEAVARYYCYTGYRLNSSAFPPDASPEQQYVEITCRYGQWRGVLPTCVMLKCARPPAPPNGRIYLVGVKGGNLPFTSPQNHPRHNDVLQYECPANQRLVGPAHAVCLAGVWSPSETPQCEPVTHPTLPPSWIFYSPALATTAAEDLD